MQINKNYNPNTKVLLKHINQNIDNDIELIVTDNINDSHLKSQIIIHNHYYNYTIGYEIISNDVLSEIIHFLLENRYYPKYRRGNTWIKCDKKIHIEDYNDGNTVKEIEKYLTI